MSVSVQQAQIVRVATLQGAKFERPDGFFLVEVWFEDGQPHMQIRSGATSLEEAGLIGIALQMAIEWAADMYPVPTPAEIKRNPVGVLAKLLQEGGAVPVINGQRIEPSAVPTKELPTRWSEYYQEAQEMYAGSRSSYLLTKACELYANHRTALDQLAQSEESNPVAARRGIAG